MKLKLINILSATLICVFAATLGSAQNDKAKVEPAVGTYTQTTVISDEILTPNVVKTSIGELKFFDGTASPETVQLVYDWSHG